jgi:SM-20-related protein
MTVRADATQSSPNEARFATATPGTSENSEASEAEPFVLIEDFLRPATYRALIDYAIGREADFSPSSVVRGGGTGRFLRPEHRTSVSILDFPGFQHLFVELLYDNNVMIRNVCALLGIEPFDIEDIECQLTAHGDGAFFKAHFDDIVRRGLRRRLSFVYYFFREPKGFEGGELRIFPHSVRPHQDTSTQVDFRPRNNALVLFASDTFHEVLPVRCAPPEFGNCRFTVNGWLSARDNAG